MRRSITKTMTVAVAAVAALAALSAPASADPTDAPGAILSNTLDIAAATIDNSTQDPNDNIACDVPKAGGSVVNQRTPYVVGEMFGNDAGFGELTCARIDGGSFTLTAQAFIQASDGGTDWGTVRQGTPTSMASRGGVAAVAPLVIGSYGAFDSALNKYHRTMVVFSTNTGRSYTMYSPSVWFMTA